MLILNTIRTTLITSSLEMPHSEQHEVIGWRDPSESASDSTTVAGNAAKVVRIFSISSTSEDLKAQLIEQIQRLGGKVSENMSKFDNECTHMLCERPCRSEKVLSCISAGKWFMCYEYIFKSAENGSFVDVSMDLFLWCGVSVKMSRLLFGFIELLSSTMVHAGGVIRMGQSESNKSHQIGRTE